MEANQYYFYQLPTPVTSVGGTWTQPLQNLPKQIFGRLAHLVEVGFQQIFAPTFSAGTVNVAGTNNAVIRCDFYDGKNFRFQGGFNVLRMKERLENGGNRIADPDVSGATTVNRDFNRVMSFGPNQMIGAPTDYAIPNGMLTNGEIRLQYGAAADVAAPTAATVSTFTLTQRMVAKMVLLDDLRIPPLYNFQTLTPNANDFIIAGRGLYTSIGLMVPTTFGAIANGDFANITLDMGYGDLVRSIQAQDLVAAFNADFNRGDFLTVQGEPANAQDVNGKGPDHTAAVAITSIAPIAADLQPVLWSPPDGRISKLFWAESQARLRWSGTRVAVLVGFGRHLSQTPQVIGSNVQLALAGTGLVPKSLPIARTQSKQPYKGYLLEFMPYRVKL